MVSGASGRSDRGRAEAPGEQEVPVSRAETMAAVRAAADGKRKQKSFYFTEECIARVNAAVFWARAGYLSAQEQGDNPIDPAELPDSASALMERAAFAEVIRLEKLFNGGKPFPEVPGKLSPGPGTAGAARLRRPRKAAESDDTATVDEQDGDT